MSDTVPILDAIAVNMLSVLPCSDPQRSSQTKQQATSNKQQATSNKQQDGTHKADSKEVDWRQSTEEGARYEGGYEERPSQRRCQEAS
jgi:hypothetical protein